MDSRGSPYLNLEQYDVTRVLTCNKHGDSGKAECMFDEGKLRFITYFCHIVNDFVSRKK